MKSEYITIGDRTVHAKDATWEDMCDENTIVPTDFNYYLLSEDVWRKQAQSFKRLRELIADWSGDSRLG